jgi:hypothetical protein
LNPSPFNALVIFISGNIVAVAFWSAPRLIPSAFSRLPGGVEEAKRRWGILAVLLMGFAVVASRLLAIGFPIVLAILIAWMVSVPVGILLIIGSHRMQPHRPSRQASTAAPPSADAVRPRVEGDPLADYEQALRADSAKTSRLLAHGATFGGAYFRA